MAENFPNLKKETDIQVQEAQSVPNKMNPNKPKPKHIIIEIAKVKDKERILKAAREKQRVNYKGTPKRMYIYVKLSHFAVQQRLDNIVNQLYFN